MQKMIYWSYFRLNTGDIFQPLSNAPPKPTYSDWSIMLSNGWGLYQCFPQIMSSGVLFCQEPRNIQFTDIEE